MEDEGKSKSPKKPDRSVQSAVEELFKTDKKKEPEK